MDELLGRHADYLLLQARIYFFLRRSCDLDDLRCGQAGGAGRALRSGPYRANDPIQRRGDRRGGVDSSRRVFCEARDEPTVEVRAQVVKVRALIRVLAVVEEQPLRRRC